MQGLRLSITIATKRSNRVSSLQSIFPPRLFLRQTANGSYPNPTHGLAQLTRQKIIKSLALAPAAPSPPIGSSNPTSLHQVSTLSAQIGRASCRERMKNSDVAGQVNKKK